MVRSTIYLFNRTRERCHDYSYVIFVLAAFTSYRVLLSCTTFRMFEGVRTRFCSISFKDNPFKTEPYEEIADIIHSEFAKHSFKVCFIERRDDSLEIFFPDWYFDAFISVSYSKNPLMSGGMMFNKSDFLELDSFQDQFDVIESPDLSVRLVPKKEWTASTGDLTIVEQNVKPLQLEYEEPSTLDEDSDWDDDDWDEDDFDDLEEDSDWDDEDYLIANKSYRISKQRVASIRAAKQRREESARAALDRLSERTRERYIRSLQQGKRRK